jgi:hypothetical protein
MARLSQAEIALEETGVPFEYPAEPGACPGPTRCPAVSAAVSALVETLVDVAGGDPTRIACAIYRLAGASVRDVGRTLNMSGEAVHKHIRAISRRNAALGAVLRAEHRGKPKCACAESARVRAEYMAKKGPQA